MTGPIAAFDGAMGSPVVRKCAIQVTEAAVFTVLTFQFPATEAGQAPPTALTYPPTLVLEYVASFQLASGSVLAAFQEA